MDETTETTETQEGTEHGTAYALGALAVCGFAAYGLYTAATKVGHKVLDWHLARKAKTVETPSKKG